MPTERERMAELTDDASNWRRWGCYVSERAWGTVREDYSASGDAWNYFPHDLARSKAYRWGEDGIAGICDRYQILCFAPAFWNHRDPFLKERLFGLSNPEGNHGEDVKECYFHLDNTPTHSYMRYLYKYPQRPFPYRQLVAANQSRNQEQSEFELLDTGIFDDDRYFDITIEYAKFDPDDLCIRIEAVNRGPQPAPFDLLAQLWFRNTWSWGPRPRPKPWIERVKSQGHLVALVADGFVRENEPTIPDEYILGPQFLYAPAGGAALFTENETNMPRVYGLGNHSRAAYVKDAFHQQIVNGQSTTNRDQRGTKAAVHYRTTIAPGGTATWDLRLSDKSALRDPLAAVEPTIRRRQREADEFYASLHPPGATEEERRIQRQAWSGLLWTKQSYIFDVSLWRDGDNPSHPPPAERRKIRNEHWPHLNSLRVMLVPDKWEYPWFASWDVAFQCVAMAEIDPKFAMDHLWILLFEQFQHPSGQIPAYEWEFSDLNPPVHAWAVWRVYNMARLGWNLTDRVFLERCFHKLLINFAWWVNKVDREGNCIFEGGFLGLDNITVVDRSQRSTNGAVLQQSDATGWMGMFCLNMMRIALELAKENSVYETLAIKFFQHYVYIAAAMKRMAGGYRLWDDEDGFFYDVLRYPDGSFRKFRVRSLVGIIPLFAVERLEAEWLSRFTRFRDNVHWFVKNRGDLVNEVVHTSFRQNAETLVLTIVNQDQLRQILRRVFDPSEFLSDFGIRSLAKSHAWQPFVFDGSQVGYEPGDSKTRIKGGNSNWRGPIWFPTSFLLIESLRKLAKAWGNDFLVPTSDGRQQTLGQLASEVANRLIRLYKRDDRGHRPAYGDCQRFQQDPAWRDLPLFHEFFHGETGAGLGATHMTGWTALVASLIDEWR